MSNPINLGRGSEWEVALTDISFPNRVYNVTDGEFTLGYVPTPTLQRYRVVVNKPDTVSKELINSYPDVPFLNQYRAFNIPKGCYTEIGQIIDAMNTQIATFTNMERTKTFAYNEETLNLYSRLKELQKDRAVYTSKFKVMTWLKFWDWERMLCTVRPTKSLLPILVILHVFTQFLYTVIL